MSDDPIEDFLPEEPVEFDWYPVLERVQTVVRLAVRDNKNVGNTLTFIEGEKWVQDLASAVVAAVRHMLPDQAP